jgi:hypothetical protein
MSNLNEKLVLKSWGVYSQLVADAYAKAPKMDSSVVHHWHSLNASNHTLFQRLLGKVNLIFTTEGNPGNGVMTIKGKKYKLIQSADPYENAQQMAADVKQNGTLKISIDHSEHPIFSVEDNVIFRTVHDYIVHILGNHPFGAKGEIASYNLHAKLVPKDAVPAIFTEVVGQACVAVTTGNFPEQKIALLPGFDYINIGHVDDATYQIKNKELMRKEHHEKLKSILESLESEVDKDELNEGKMYDVVKPHLKTIRESLVNICETRKKHSIKGIDEGVMKIIDGFNIIKDVLKRQMP